MTLASRLRVVCRVAATLRGRTSLNYPLDATCERSSSGMKSTCAPLTIRAGAGRMADTRAHAEPVPFWVNPHLSWRRRLKGLSN